MSSPDHDAPPTHGAARRRLAGPGFLQIERIVLGQAQRADERRQGEALEHEGGQDHPEREKDDLVAKGKRMARGRGHRQGERGGEGDDAAHADPRDQQDV